MIVHYPDPYTSIDGTRRVATYCHSAIDMSLAEWKDYSRCIDAKRISANPSNVTCKSCKRKLIKCLSQ